MDFYDAVNARQSIRSYTEDPVPDDVVERILEAGIRAPSAGNLQSWHFIVIADAGLKKALAEAAGQPFIGAAARVIVVFADEGRASSRYGDRGKNLYCLQDTAAAAQTMLLAITAEGLGACLVGAFDEQAVSESLGIDESLRPVGMIPFGVPVRLPERRSRRPLNEVVEWR